MCQAVPGLSLSRDAAELLTANKTFYDRQLPWCLHCVVCIQHRRRFIQPVPEQRDRDFQQIGTLAKRFGCSARSRSVVHFLFSRKSLLPPPASPPVWRCFSPGRYALIGSSSVSCTSFSKSRAPGMINSRTSHNCYCRGGRPLWRDKRR